MAGVPNIMITSTPRALRALLLAAVVIAPQPVTWASEADADPAALVRLDASRVSWQRARLKASKLLVSMDVDMRIDTHDGPALSRDLAGTTEGRAIAAGEAVTSLTYLTEALGRHNVSELFLDAQTGAVLQRTSHDTGSRLRWRRYRFTDIGAMRWTARPSSDEENLPPAGWSERSSELRRFPTGMPDAPLTEASALIYLVAASDLAQPGDRLQMLAYSSSSDVVHRVTVAVAERDKVSVDYRSRQGASGSRRQERVRALRVTIDGQPLPGQDDDAFELLGMHDIELYVDPETRAPLLLVGQVSILGQIRFELEELVLHD